MQDYLKKFAVIAAAVAMLASYSGVLAHGDEVHDTREEDVQHRIDQRQILLEARQEQAEARAAEIRAQRQAQLEERQSSVRAQMEERMQNRIEQMMDRLNAVNDRQTDAYLNHLNRVEVVLDKILGRIDRLGEEHPDLDLSDVRAQADLVRAQIGEARTAVLAQKAKIYTVEIDDVETMGEAMRGVVAEMRGDLKELRDDHIKPVREALREMFQELKDAVVEYRQSLEDEEETEEEETEE